MQYKLFIAQNSSPPPHRIQVFRYSGIQTNKRDIPVQIEFLLYI